MKSLASEVIAAIGPRLGLTINLEPQYRYVGQIVTSDGRKFYFRNTNFDLNGQGASEIARDKDYAAYYMGLMGYPVPEGRAFYSDRWSKAISSDRNKHQAYEYARTLGFPVIVKPNSKSQGTAVAKVYNKRELMAALRDVFNVAKDRVALVQRPVDGDDYRIVVLDDEVISAYRRLPLSVVGDGKSTIEDLLGLKQLHFDRVGRDTKIKLGDSRMRRRLSRLRMDLNTILPNGESLNLLDNANLSTGGDAIDVTDVIHVTYQRIAVQLTKDMGLRYCGVDLITTSSIEEPIDDYTILEVNAAPGVDHYAYVGDKQMRVVEDMYEKIIRSITGLDDTLAV